MDPLKKIEKAIEDGHKKIEAKQASLEERLSKVEEKKRVSLPGAEYGTGKNQFSLFRALRAIHTGDWRNAGYEREVFDNTRAMSAALDASGGYWIPEEVANDFIEVLYANQVTVALGARVMDGLTASPISIPGMSAGATGYWVGSNEAITLSTPTTFRRQLQHKKVAGIVAVDNELLKLSLPSAEKIVVDDLAETLALKIDLAAMYGSGVSGEPLGIINDPDVDTTTVAIGTNGGDFKFQHASELMQVLDEDNALKGRLGYATHPIVKHKLKRERIPQFSGDTDGAYHTLPIMSDQQLDSMLGYGLKSTSQLPKTLVKGSSSDCAPVIFGNWQDLIIGYWGGIEIAKSDSATDGSTYAFTQDQTWFRASMLVDSLVRRPNSFACCLDARTN